MKILLDTNFCVYAAKNAWLLEEIAGFEVIIPDFIIGEIEKVAPQKKDIIMELTGRIGAKTLKTGFVKGNVDDELVKTALTQKSAIATNDLELRRKASKKGVQTYYASKAKVLRNG